jgi:hypothetical protein
MEDFIMQLSTILNAQIGDRVNIAAPNEKPYYVTVDAAMKKKALDFYQNSFRAESGVISTPDSRSRAYTNKATDDVTLDTLPKNAPKPSNYKTAVDTNQEMYNKINQRATAPMSPAPNTATPPSPISAEDARIQASAKSDTLPPRNSMSSKEGYLDSETQRKNEQLDTELDKQRSAAGAPPAVLNAAQGTRSNPANATTKNYTYDPMKTGLTPEQADAAMGKKKNPVNETLPEASFENIAKAKPGDKFVRKDGTPVTVWSGDISWAKNRVGGSTATKPESKPATKQPDKPTAKPATSSHPEYKEDETIVGNLREGWRPEKSVSDAELAEMQAVDAERIKQRDTERKAQKDAEHKKDAEMQAADAKRAPKRSNTPAQNEQKKQNIQNDISNWSYTPQYGNGLPNPPVSDTVSDDRMKNILAGVRPPEYVDYGSISDRDQSISNIVDSING